MSARTKTGDATEPSSQDLQVGSKKASQQYDEQQSEPVLGACLEIDRPVAWIKVRDRADHADLRPVSSASGVSEKWTDPCMRFCMECDSCTYGLDAVKKAHGRRRHRETGDVETGRIWR